jgi:hypothetical protein
MLMSNTPPRAVLGWHDAVRAPACGAASPRRLPGRVPEYEAHVRYLVARMRSGYSRHIGDPDWEEDIRRLASLSREFADLWARHEVADPEPRTLTYLHPQAGTLCLAVSELQVPAMPEARIVVYTPQDDQTREKMPLTRRAAPAGPVAGAAPVS